MDVQDYLKQVADVTNSDIPDDDGQIYVTKHDGSYITRVGMEDSVRYLAEQEITDDLTNGVGFSPKDGKWYGWSHRAIYGFKTGSTCNLGDCHYRTGGRGEWVAETIEDAKQMAVDFNQGVS
jgi:hypothetical protein